MPTKAYRCITSTLNVRTAPSVNADKAGTLRFNEVVNVQLETRTVADGNVWIKHDKGWSAERATDGKTVFMLDAIQNRDRMWGINIDPDNPNGTSAPDKLIGLGWVRFVFHVESRQRTLAQTFAFYDPLINAYAANGTRVLLILLQDTYWGNGPWSNNGDWREYARGFGQRTGEIAAHYKGKVAAYEIWNEGDFSGAPTSIYVAPENYAPLLLAASQAIAMVDPGAQVVSGGLASGLDTAVAYMRAVRDQLGGVLPCDGIAVHPYGQTPPVPDAEPFPGWSFGSLQTYLNKFADTFPGMQIWITEFGVPRIQDVTNQEFWARIANYMQKTVEWLRSSYPQLIPAMTWFSWSDAMDRSGITTDQQQPKGVLYAQFYRQIHADYPPIARTATTSFDGRVALFHVSGDTLPDANVGDLARRVAQSAPNVRDFIVRTSVGSAWSGQTASRTVLSIRSKDDLLRWAAEFAKVRIDLFAWHQIQAKTVQDTTTELNFLNQVMGSLGVKGLVLDLGTGILTDSNKIRNFMIPLRKSFPQPYQIHLSFDARPDFLQNVTFSEWYPFINSWMPRIPVTPNASVSSYLTMASNALKPFRRPIIPVLQPGSSTAANGDSIRAALLQGFETYNMPSVGFHRLQDFSSAEFETIRSVTIPFTAGYTPNVPQTLTCKSAGLKIRILPQVNALITGTLNQGDKVNVLERANYVGFEWGRHALGWSAIRNIATGEILLG